MYCVTEYLTSATVITQSYPELSRRHLWQRIVFSSVDKILFMYTRVIFTSVLPGFTLYIIFQHPKMSTECGYVLLAKICTHTHAWYCIAPLVLHSTPHVAPQGC